VEEDCYSLFRGISQEIGLKTEETLENIVSGAGNSAEVKTGYVPNTNPDPCRYTSVFLVNTLLNEATSTTYVK
jgi:hypothetical protein